MKSLKDELNSSGMSLKDQVQQELEKEQGTSRATRSRSELHQVGKKTRSKKTDDNLVKSSSGSKGISKNSTKGSKIKKKKNKVKNKVKSNKFIKLIATVIIAFFAISAVLTIPVLFESPFSVVILGIDTGVDRQGGSYEGEDKFYGSRADVIQYVTVNPRKNHLTAMQIPRDTNVEYSCENYDGVTRDHNYKVNEAHVNGGVDCMIDALEQGLALPVDYYVRLDFNDFVDVIDDLGGVEIKSIDTFCEQDSNANANAYCFTEGQTYEMTGEEALAYARHRKTSSDFRRGQRQQQIVEALARDLKKMGLKQAIAVGLDIIDGFDHNVPLTKMSSLGARMVLRGAPSYKVYGYESVRINGTQHPDPSDLKDAYAGTYNNLGMSGKVSEIKKAINQRYDDMGYVKE